MNFQKYILFALVTGVAAYNSVYFRKLDEVKTSRSAGEFNATQYVDIFWNQKLPNSLESAIDLSQLVAEMQTDTAKVFDAYSHALGIGNLRYFLVDGTGTVEQVGDDEITIVTKSGVKATIAMEFIFGNAVRDASGLIDVNDFTNTMDFNNVSAEINKIIRESVLPPFKAKVKKSDNVSFIGAIELNSEHVDLKKIEVIPIQLTIVI